MPKAEGALKFFFCDGLTWDDVFDWHGGIVMRNRETPSPVSPKGEKLIPPETKVALLWTITTAILISSPFSFLRKLKQITWSPIAPHGISVSKELR
jgi:hypothetical protein